MTPTPSGSPACSPFSAMLLGLPGLCLSAAAFIFMDMYDRVIPSSSEDALWLLVRGLLLTGFLLVAYHSVQAWLTGRVRRDFFSGSSAGSFPSPHLVVSLGGLALLMVAGTFMLAGWLVRYALGGMAAVLVFHGWRLFTLKRDGASQGWGAWSESVFQFVLVLLLSWGVAFRVVYRGLDAMTGGLLSMGELFCACLLAGGTVVAVASLCSLYRAVYSAALPNTRDERLGTYFDN